MRSLWRVDPHAHMADSETMKLPALCICGGVGIDQARVLVRKRKSSRLAGTQIGGGAGSDPQGFSIGLRHIF